MTIAKKMTIQNVGDSLMICLFFAQCLYLELLCVNKIKTMSTQINGPAISPKLLELVGAGNLTIMETLEILYKSNYVKYTIAILLTLLLAFEHEVHVFSKPITFWSLLSLTIALITTELFHSPGFILLMLALTVISYNMSTSKLNKSSER